jgi:ELWxxDGT repeat protein
VFRKIFLLCFYFSCIQAQERITAIQGNHIGSNPHEFVETTEKIFFKATTEYSGTEAYVFDKKTQKTMLLGDFLEGSISSFDNYYPFVLGRVDIFRLQKFKEKLYFLGKKESIYDNPYIYTSDGNNTSINDELAIALRNPIIQMYATELSLIFFVRNEKTNKIEVWESDGSIEQTKKIIDTDFKFIPYYPSTIQILNSTDKFITFKINNALSLSPTYQLDLEKSQIVDLKLPDYKEIFLKKDLAITSKVENDSTYFFINDKKADIAIFTGQNSSYYFFKVFESNNPKIYYLVTRLFQSNYSVYSINTDSKSIVKIKDFENVVLNEVPLTTPILKTQFIYYERKFNDNQWVMTLKTLDLTTTKTNSIISWITNYRAKSDDEILYSYPDYQTFSTLIGDKIVVNLSATTINNNFTKFTESWLIDVDKKQGKKLQNFILHSNPTNTEIAKNEYLVVGSLDSLFFRNELFILDTDKGTTRALERIDKGRNRFTSVGLANYKVFWDKNTMYSSDGTKASTKQILKLEDMTFSRYIVANNQLFIVAEGKYNKNQTRLTKLRLYTTDGTPQNINLVNEIIHGNDSPFYYLFKYQNECYFITYDNNNKWKYVVSDGSKIGTKVFQDLFEESLFSIEASSSEDYLIVKTSKYKNSNSYDFLVYEIEKLENKPQIIFSKNNTSYSGEFNIIKTANRPVIVDEKPNEFQVLITNSNAIKVIQNPDNRFELSRSWVLGNYAMIIFREKITNKVISVWRVDIVDEKIEEISTPKLSHVFSYDYTFINSSKSKLFFQIIKNQIPEYWITDGSEDGTFLIEDERDIYKLYPNKKAFFAPTKSNHQYALWVSDGTRDGTYKKVDSLGLGSGYVNELEYFYRIVDTDRYKSFAKSRYIIVYDVEKDSLMQFEPLNIAKYPTYSYASIINNKLIFLAHDKEISMQLWRFELENDNQELEQEQILTKRFFPNPTENEVTILYKPKSKTISIFVYDLKGNLVSENTINSPYLDDLKANLAGFSQGLYLVVLQDGKELISQRIVKY